MSAGQDAFRSLEGMVVMPDSRPGSAFPQFLFSDLRGLVWFALVACAPVVGGFLTGVASSSHSAAVLAHVGALAVWAFCLRRSGLPAVWASVAVFGLASVFVTSSFGMDASALGEAVFLYMLLSLLAAYDKQPNLQAIAASALLISGGILTKPPVAIACVLISIMFFLLHCRRTSSGSLGFALLMFTPAVLCAVSASFLAVVTGGALSASAVVQGAVTPRPESSVMSMWWLLFPASVVALRVCLRRASACDAALGFMLLGTLFLSSFPGIPHHIQPIDSFYLALGGGAALLAHTPAESSLARLIACGSLLFAAFYPTLR